MLQLFLDKINIPRPEWVKERQNCNLVIPPSHWFFVTSPFLGDTWPAPTRVFLLSLPLGCRSERLLETGGETQSSLTQLLTLNYGKERKLYWQNLLLKKLTYKAIQPYYCSQHNHKQNTTLWKQHERKVASRQFKLSDHNKSWLWSWYNSLTLITNTLF